MLDAMPEDHVTQYKPRLLPSFLVQCPESQQDAVLSSRFLVARSLVELQNDHWLQERSRHNKVESSALLASQGRSPKAKLTATSH